MIINSILDTDLYKFTTSYAYLKLFPYASGTFVFKDRDETVYTNDFLDALQKEINNMANISLNTVSPTKTKYWPACLKKWNCPMPTSSRSPSSEHAAVSLSRCKMRSSTT